MIFRLIIFSFFSFLSDVFAQTDNNSYTVKNIKIERTDVSAKSAMDKALLDSQTEAFWLLVQRMVFDEELAKIPKDLSLKEITPLIQSFSIVSERITQKTYSAILNYEFDPVAVKNFFDQHLIAYIENFIPDMLILPLMVNGSTVSLWEENNSWMHTWKEEDDIITRLPYKLPLSDVSDLSILQGGDVFQQRREKIDLLANKYKVQDILICTLNINSHTLDPSTSDVNVDITHYNMTGNSTLKFPSFDHSGPLTPELLKKIKQESLNTAWKIWKKQGTLISNQTQEFLFTVEIDDLKMLQDIKNRLSQVRIIKEIKYTNISKPNSQMSIIFSRDLNFLKEEINKVGLDLSQKSSQWHLKLK